jgi:rhamnogalacturonan endolyase
MSHFSVKNTLLLFLGLLLFVGCEMMGGSEAADVPRQAKSTGPDVTITEDETSYVLSNDIVTARIAKRNGDLVSLQYKGLETLFTAQGRVGAYWSQDATGGTSVIPGITIDPTSNNGDRAEVSVKGIRRADVQSDVEFRFSMGRGESGVYTYLVFDHLAEYAASGMPESRWVAKLSDIFDYTQVDDERLMREVTPETFGHLYVNAGAPFEHRAYGWASSKKNVGLWLINASTEYIGGGATKTDFLTHRDNPPSAVYAPCILNFWKGSHFGNGAVSMGQGEHWTKVLGPMFIYCNSGSDPLAIRKDAVSQASAEVGKWPYEWVAGVDYAQRDQRTNVKGQLVLADPLKPNAKMSNVLVGLAHPAYTPPAVAGRGGRGRGAAAPNNPAAAPNNPAAAPNNPAAAPNNPAAAPDDPAAARGGGNVSAPVPAGRLVEWQADAKYYQYWTKGQDNGNFSIPNVRPGNYTLHAIADGVLGEYAKADITVEAGKPINLGKLTWTPVRRGKQVWDVGVPNRSAKEFTYGDKFFDPGAALVYPKMFPNDVNFIIGKSDPRKDWFYMHLPHAIDDSGQLAGNQGVTGTGRATPYKISFDMPSAPKGQATLRLAICGTQARTIEVTINNKPAGQVSLGGSDVVIPRHGSTGVWYEREVAFDATLMNQGANELTLTIPAGAVNNGVLYDYVRLELAE